MQLKHLGGRLKSVSSAECLAHHSWHISLPYGICFHGAQILGKHNIAVDLVCRNQQKPKKGNLIVVARLMY